jgi:hypothetical protein
MPSFLFFFFYVGVCSIICVRRKTSRVLSLVAAFFLDKTADTSRRKVSQKCWHKPPSETKLVQKERKNLMRKHLRSQKREKINRGKSEFCVQKKFKNFSSVVSSRWSGF